MSPVGPSAAYVQVRKSQTRADPGKLKGGGGGGGGGGGARKGVRCPRKKFEP